MKIARVEILPVVITQEDPEWRFALGGSAKHRNFLIKLISDEGFIGIGYTSATAHAGATKEGARAALEKYAESLIGEDPFNIEKIFRNLERILWRNNGAKVAIDIALHDLQAKALGLPLYALLGGLVRDEIPVIRIIPLKEPAQMAANAVRLVEKGYLYLKIKLDGDASKDLARVQEIRKAVGDTIHLTVDANQQYLPKAAINVIKRMQEQGIELCEQPVRADDWQGLSAVARAVDCFVEAHESAESVEQIFGLVKDRVADSINLKIALVGGLRNAKVAAALCRIGNVSCRVGTGNSQIFAAASMHFIAATENIFYACEVGEFARSLDDPVSGLEIKDGKLKVPTAPGLGVTLEDRKIKNAS